MIKFKRRCTSGPGWRGINADNSDLALSIRVLAPAFEGERQHRRRFWIGSGSDRRSAPAIHTISVTAVKGAMHRTATVSSKSRVWPLAIGAAKGILRQPSRLEPSRDNIGGPLPVDTLALADRIARRTRAAGRGGDVGVVVHATPVISDERRPL